MTDTELFNTLALLRVEGVGDIMAKKLISHCGSATEVFKAKKSKITAIDGVGETAWQNLQDKNVFKQAEAEMKFIEKEGIKASYFMDADYPEKLKHCIDGPVILFSSGNINLEGRKIVSIVGTRQVTSYGAEFCRKLVEDLAPLNPVIVSGFAYGVDIVAHQAALDNNLQTIGVLAHGLNQIYPKAHKKYMAKMEENGGFMTEFWSTSNPDRENFLKRNRIIAGIAEATVVIESADKGGSLVTANLANDYNRDVFAVPGRATDKYSQGCNNLIKTQRANLLAGAADIIYLLNWQLEEKKHKPVQKQLFVSLEGDEQKVYDYLQRNGKELMDVIALECELPVFKISSLLLNMELKGVIRPLPGKLFEAI
ncbi:DNA-protecting protein DprA [Flavobacterium cyanobacteriorum]|uniref:DNA-protecting protein DprA n=1 Tax=Flavobacterium cyanobacteriorum TaxID=2022802 RepID=A0A256A036_9FLAO|nr:DNA-processing protein DprA [Flavobacterium cyanobacteriorum]OYQ47157.1 DNA-protecting protein DprA [Flavobacterium cyanobacteriorum]